MKKLKKDNNIVSLLKLFIIGFAVIVLGVSGYLGYKSYQNYLANKIYSVDEIVRLSDFKFEITKSEFNDIKLSLDEESVDRFGSTDIKEDCNNWSKEKTWMKAWHNDPEAPWIQFGPSEYNVCILRNDSRDEINKYVEDNQNLIIEYKITAINNVKVSDLKIEILPNTGRDLSKEADPFKHNQFFRGAQTINEAYRDEIFKYLGAPGPVMGDVLEGSLYDSYIQSKLSGDINKGLERTGYVNADIRKSEISVDIKIIYNNETRLMRIKQ